MNEKPAVPKHDGLETGWGSADQLAAGALKPNACMLAWNGL